MPCRGPSNEDILRAERQEDREKICHLEGVICAILTELPNYNVDVEQFIFQCEKHGKIYVIGLAAQAWFPPIDRLRHLNSLASPIT